MVKQLPSGSGIVKQSNKPSLTPNKEYAELIGVYLYKYAAIAKRDIDEELIGIYVEALHDLSLSRLKVGLKMWLEEGEHFPWPSEIRRESEL